MKRLLALLTALLLLLCALTSMAEDEMEFDDGDDFWIEDDGGEE